MASSVSRIGLGPGLGFKHAEESFNLPRGPLAASGIQQFVEESPRPLQEPCFNLGSHAAVEIADGAPKKNLVSKECPGVGCLFATLVATNDRPMLRAQQKGDLLLGQAGTLSVGAKVVWKPCRWHVGKEHRPCDIMEGMGAADWLSQNWFAVVQTGAVLAALAFTGVGFFFDARSHRVGNLIRLTDRHRELWERVYSDPKLARILEPKADLDRDPVTAAEELFMIFFILHLANTFYTVRSGFLKQPEGLTRDVQLVLALPIPMAVWRKVRNL
ncbi:MAG: hypothetical protein KGS61_18555, partial [Verrucomicrobia bacterium]|nr:hypothetical protein [Verrucomicrobiota bacterium]